MPNIDSYEPCILTACEKGPLPFIATKAELARLKAAARATSLNDRRVNIRLSSGDLSGMQAMALAEGVPYQTLIATLLHKYVTGRLVAGRVPYQVRQAGRQRHRSIASARSKRNMQKSDA